MRKVAGMLARRTALLALVLCGCFGRSSRGEVHLRDDAPPPGNDLSPALYQSLGVKLQGGHRVTWLLNGQLFDAVQADVERAHVSINIVTFIWADGKASDRLLEALRSRVGHGAACRILIDSVGTLNPKQELKDKLRASGCDVRWMRPVPGQDDAARDHRKLVIVDGRVGFTGGFGIDDKWLGGGMKDKEWRDSAVRLEGPAVAQMQQAFAENWQESGGPLLPETDFPEPRRMGTARAAFVASTEHSVITRADRLMQLLISSAHARLWIQNAYFVPSEPLLSLLARKAKAGIDIRVLSAGDKTDTGIYLPKQRARLDDLVKDGAHAYEYGPAMMHAKTVLVDDRLVAVGSCNLDALSLNKLDEGMLVVDDADFASELAEQWRADLSRSTELRPK